MAAAQSPNTKATVPAVTPDTSSNGNGAGRGKRKERSEIQKKNLQLMRAAKNLYEASRDFEQGGIEEDEFEKELTYWGDKVARILDGMTAEEVKVP
jgi:hypothetical protein